MTKQDFYRQKYKELNPAWTDCLTLYKNIVNKYLKIDGYILDIGCGHADFMKDVYSKTLNTYGIDPDKRALDKNTIIKNKVEGSAEKIPFDNSMFDVATSEFVLEHLENPKGVFSEINRVLKPNGYVIFLTPNVWNYNVWLIRSIPEVFHDYLNRKFYGRQENDTFKKFYRINSPAQIHKTMNSLGYKKVDLLLNGDPSYISFNNLLFKVACFIEKFFSAFWINGRVHIIGVYQKSAD